MDLERYNRSFEEHVILLEEEADARLQVFRQKCLQEFVSRLTIQRNEWDAAFRELLKKSQEETPELKSVTFAEKPSVTIIYDHLPVVEEKEVSTKQSESIGLSPIDQPSPIAEVHGSNPTTTQVSEEKTPVPPLLSSSPTPEYNDPFPSEAQDHFTNNLAIKEFIRIQDQQEKNRQSLHELNTSAALKPFKNELSLFIRTQINSISNGDFQHTNTKTKILVNLFQGQPMTFQDRSPVCAMKHPQGQLLAMDIAAQTFVTVGTRLVNSVPAIAKSMATVISGLVESFPIFKDLIIGHLQERCPYLVPMYPQLSDFGSHPGAQTRYKVACGYTNDNKTQALESEEKYLARMRSMALIFGCIIIQSESKGHAWGWLASFLSLNPQPVITATILQAFLQEASRVLSLTYRIQYKKLLMFIQTDYVGLIEKVSKQPGDRQSLIKLKNQLTEDLASKLL